MKKIYVTIGQVKIATKGHSLHAILGSCIGIGFLFHKRGVYGLAHCLLSESRTEAGDLSARHVDTAIASLSTLMALTVADRRKVQVFLTGGANMTLPVGTNPKRLVGAKNSEFALKAVKKAGYRIQHNDLGGTVGRQVTISCDEGTYSIAEIPRLRG